METNKIYKFPFKLVKLLANVTDSWRKLDRLWTKHFNTNN